MVRVAAALLALALPGVASAQRAGTDVRDPATVHWSDVATAYVVVPDCQDWEPAITACAFRALPPKRCVFEQTAGKQMFDILAVALEAPRVEAPVPSKYSKAAVVMRLRDGRELVVQIPLTPSLEDSGNDDIWITYGDRRVRLDRTQWDEISDLAQSPGCVRQPPSWTF